MAKFAARSYVNGTLALQPKQAPQRSAAIIAFPEKRTQAARRPKTGTTGTWAQVTSAIRSIAHRSEMYCSLVRETCAGCAYNLFAKRQVLGFGIVVASMLALGLVFGA